MTVAILVPLLGRPHRVRPLIASIEAATPEPHRTVLLCTRDDAEVITEANAVHRDYPVDVVTVGRRPMGDYAMKINLGVTLTDEPFVFTGACDLDFFPDWLPAALALMDDPAIGVVGTQDMCNKRVLIGEHSTHSLVRRSYIEEFGTIDEPGKLLHEGYWHELVDDELVATAKHRGAWAFAWNSIVEHLHPMAGKAPMDDMYALQRHRIVQGRRLFELRKWMWTSPS